MARIFYAVLLGITAALGSVVWARHGRPNLWAHLFGARTAQAQTAGAADTLRGDAVALSPASSSPPEEYAPPADFPVEQGPAAPSRRSRGYLARRASASWPGTAARLDEAPRPREPVPGDDAQAFAARPRDHFTPTSVVAGPDFARQKIDLDVPTRTSPREPAAPAPPPLEPAPIPFENTKVLARVGSDVILAGDVIPSALESYNEKVKKIPKGQPVSPEALEQEYAQEVRFQVQALVKIKLLFAQARKKIPEDKLPELQKQIEKNFEDKAIPHFLETEQCKTRQELEAKLKQTGNSIERVKRNFVEAQIAQQWFHDQVKKDDQKVTHEEMLASYHENLAKYEHPATVRYEELVAKLSKYGGEAAARAALAEMGNLVYKGAPWADVAKAKSDGSSAAEGGRQEIRQGSHVSRVLDEAIFSLPVGALSPILADLDPKLKDRRGFYIVRVIERKPAWTTPFTEVQAELAETIKKERIVKKQTEYMMKIVAETPPWTIFDRPNVAEKPQPDRYQR